MKKTTENLKKEYTKLIKERTTEELVECFELTTESESPYIYQVRGWLMEELEKREPKKFNMFLYGFYEDHELRNFILQ